MYISNIYAQGNQLPQPMNNGGMALSEALDQRHSVREFARGRDVSLQTLSNLLWSAAGINRPETGMRTNPTAMNSQEIDLYVFSCDGVYLYNYKDNRLDKKADGDHRALVAGTKEFSQDFVLDAPFSVVMIADLTRFEHKADRNLSMAMIDGGIVSQNINLFCTANGLATVPRVTMDSDGIRALLALPETSVPVINNPVGYAK